MAIRDWSKRRLGIAWALGLALELVLILVPIVQRHARMTRLQREQDQLLRNIPPLSEARRDSLLTRLRDSAGVSINTRNDTVHITFSPETQRKLQPLGSAMKRGLMFMVMFSMLAAAIVYLPIPLLLIAITLTWQRGRRQRAATGLPAHVV